MLGPDCHYIHTDGFIVRSGRERDVFQILADYGFRGGVKAEGDTEIFGVASWKVGTEITRRHDKSPTDFSSPIMGKEQRTWLRKQLSIFNRVLGV
jgi:hypothetical protein